MLRTAAFLLATSLVSATDFPTQRSIRTAAEPIRPLYWLEVVSGVPRLCLK